MPCGPSTGGSSAQMYQSRCGRVGAAAGALEPRVLVGGVIDHEVGDHPHAAVPRGAHELDELTVAAQPGVDAVEVGDVVAVVAVRRWVVRHQPHTGHTQAVQVVDALDQATEVAVSIAVAVLVSLNVQAVDDRVPPPQVRRAGQPHDSSGRTRASNASMNSPAPCHVVQVDLVEAKLSVRLSPCGVPAEIGRYVDHLGHLLGADVLGGLVEVLGPLQVPAHRTRWTPLAVRDRQCGVLVRRPAQVHLEVQLAAPAGVAVGVNHLPRLLDRRVYGDQTVGPLRAPARGLRAHRRPGEHRQMPVLAGIVQATVSSRSPD